MTGFEPAIVVMGKYDKQHQLYWINKEDMKIKNSNRDLPQLTVDSKMFNIYFADDWLQTVDLWNQKRPLYQLSHDHCPALSQL